MTTDVVIRGGYLKHPWVPVLEETDGTQFYSISKSDRGFAFYCGLDMAKRQPWDDNGFLEYLHEKRNTAVADAMQKASAAEADPLHDSEGSDAAPKRPKKDLVDEIPRVLELCLVVTSPCGIAYSRQVGGTKP